MQFIKRNIWTLAAMVLFVTVAMVGDAAAVDGTSLMTQASKKVSNVFEAYGWFSQILHSESSRK